MMWQQVRYAANRLYNQAVMMLGRGRTTTGVDDTGVVRKVQALLGFNQTKDSTYLVQHYGFASNPPVGTDCIAGFIAGDRANGCIVATNNQTYALKNMGDGTVAIYDMFGNTIVLSNTGIAVNTPLSVEITAAANIGLVASDTIDLTANQVVIHANQTLKYDAGGNGTTITPDTRTDYVIGSTGTSDNLNPPQIP